MTTFDLHTFKGGRDLRLGKFAGKDKDRFKVLTNYYTGKDKFLHRRSPVRGVSGTLSANAQGMVILAGSLYSLAKKGDVVAHTIVSPVINTLFFDNPDNCTTWQLIQAIVFDGKVVATVRHTYPAASAPSQIRLHVFDASTNKPTYVEDPWCPTSWGPTLPLHLYRTGTPGAFLDYSPRLAVAANKLMMSGPDGNLYFSKVKNARAWNTRSPQEMLDQGEWWYFIKPTATGVSNFIVSEKFADLYTDQKWSAYILEALDNTNTWSQFIENTAAGAPSDGHYYPATIASRFAGGSNEIQLQVRNDALPAGTVYRFRMIAGDPPYKIVSGNSVEANTTEAFSGNAVATIYICTGILLPPTGSGFSPLPLLVYVGGVLKATPADYSVTYNTLNQAVVTFVAAPAVGAANVLIIRDGIVYRPGTTTYEGAAVVQSYTQSARIPAGSTYLINIQGWTDVTAAPTLVPFPVSGAARYGSRFYRKITVNTPIPNPSADVIYTYGSATGATSAFYQDKSAAYLVMAGFGEAGFLTTQSKNPNGGLIVDLSAVNSNVIVHYPSQSQLWSVHADQTLDQILDTSDIGSGEHSGGTSVKFYNEVLVLTARGLRLFESTNLNNDNLEDNNIGSAIEEFQGYEFVAGCFWPHTGQLVCAIDNGAATELHVFDFSKEDKISSWSKWESLDITRIAANGLIPIGSKLYVLSLAGGLVYFDAASTNKAYDSDVSKPYTSTVKWPLFNFERPSAWKDFVSFGIAATGTWATAFELLCNDDQLEVAGPADEGSSYGKGRVDLSMSAQAIAPIIRNIGAADFSGSTDSVIEMIEVDYNLVRLL